jgi:hypothetical protein
LRSTTACSCRMFFSVGIVKPVLYICSELQISPFFFRTSDITFSSSFFKLAGTDVCCVRSLFWILEPNPCSYSSKNYSKRTVLYSDSANSGIRRFCNRKACTLYMATWDIVLLDAMQGQLACRARCPPFGSGDHCYVVGQ